MALRGESCVRASSAGGFKASENRAVAGEFLAGFSCKRSSARGTLLVVAVGGLVASSAGPSVSSGTRFESGSSSAAAFSSTSVDGSTVADSEGVAACPTIGVEKLNHIPRKRAIGRMACPGLSGVIETRWQSVSCVRFVIFCEARLSIDLALVKELHEDWHPSPGIREAGAPVFA